MSDFWTFAASNPLTAFALACVVGGTVTAPFRWGFRAYNRSLRARNIALHGWPTAPIDADGDVVYPGAEENRHDRD